MEPSSGNAVNWNLTGKIYLDFAVEWLETARESLKEKVIQKKNLLAKKVIKGASI